MREDISGIACDSYVDPMGLLEDDYPEAFNGQTPIYLMRHPWDEIIFVSNKSFTLEEAMSSIS